MYKITVMFCLLVVVTGCSADEAVTDSTVSIEVDSALLNEGRVVLHSVFENKGASSLTFLSWGTPFDSIVSSQFLEINAQVSGELHAVQYNGIMIKRGPPQSSDYKKIDSGQTLSNRLDITKSYTFCRGRAYILSYEGPLLTSDNSELSLTKVTAKFSAGGSFPTCNSTD